jgi:Tfp pilus assembly protein PilF
MSDYGEAVTKIAFYERFAVIRERNRAVEGLLAHNRRAALDFLLKRVKSHPKDYKASHLLAYLYEYNDDHRRYGAGFDMPRAIEL